MRGTFLYIGQRLVLIAITTVLVSSIVFILLHQIPGNAFLNETRTSPQGPCATREDATKRQVPGPTNGL